MKMRRITSLVLLNLGVLGGCKPGEAPAPAEGSTLAPATASATPTAIPTVTATATATATATVTATATATATGRSPVLGRTCRTDKDCPGAFCALGFDGATFSDTGRCVAERPMYKGRPIVIDGEARLARAIGRGSVRPDSVRLRKAALEEHASIGAFARTICELMALGAPSWLIYATSSAMADEVRHAEETFAWVERLGGGSWRPGPLTAAVAPLRAGPTAAAELYRDVFRGGAVGETLAAAHADEESRAAAEDELRAFHATIAADEARHAALAFRTLQWLSSCFPEVAAVRDEEVSAFRSSAGADALALIEPLLASLAPVQRPTRRASRPFA